MSLSQSTLGGVLGLIQSTFGESFQINMDEPTSLCSAVARSLVLEHILPESLPKSLMANLITFEVNLKIRFTGSREGEDVKRRSSSGLKRKLKRLVKARQSLTIIEQGPGPQISSRY